MVMDMEGIKIYHCVVHGYETQLMQAQVVPLPACAHMKNESHISKIPGIAPTDWELRC
jgi:hypothetical protein